MLRILEHIKARDWSHGLMLGASLAFMTCIWIVSASVLNRPTPREAQLMHAQREAQKQHMQQKPKGADIPIIKPFVADYTLPPASNGMAPLITRIDTKQPIVFLTIDDGAYKGPDVVTSLQAHQLKATLFLAKSFIANDPYFFNHLTAQGSRIENHTLSHDLKMTKDMNYTQQKAEICGMADYEQATYGRRPIYYRPPGGAYTDVMRKAAYDCGMKAVVTWMVTINNGSLQYQIGDKLRPGDIVLMHFRTTFLADINAFVTAEKAAGLHTELLEDAIRTS